MEHCNDCDIVHDLNYCPLCEAKDQIKELEEQVQTAYEDSKEEWSQKGYKEGYEEGFQEAMTEAIKHQKEPNADE